MTDKTTIIILSICVAILCTIALVSINQSNTSPSTVCNSGKVIVYEDGSVACVTNIKGAE